MTLSQDERDAIVRISAKVDSAEGSPLIRLIKTGGIKLAESLEEVPDKESAAIALFALGGSCIGSADPSDDDDFMQMHIGIVSLYAANELLK